MKPDDGRWLGLLAERQMLLLLLGLVQLLGLLVTALQLCCRELKDWRVCAQCDRQQGRSKSLRWLVDDVACGTAALLAAGRGKQPLPAADVAYLANNFISFPSISQTRMLSKSQH